MTGEGRGDTLTVLRTVEGRFAAKTLSQEPDGSVIVSDFDAGALFRQADFEVADIRSLGEALSSLAGDPTAFVIRGRLAPGRKPRKDGILWRRKAYGAWKGYFEECPRQWVCIDSDGVPLDGLSQVEQPEACVKRIVTLLGAPWSQATCWWQASAKAGLSPNIRIHLWFWLSEAVGSSQLRVSLQSINAKAGLKVADAALCDSIQPHYTAAPILNGGLRDPVTVRHGFCFGETDCVDASALPREVTRSRSPRDISRPPHERRPHPSQDRPPERQHSRMEARLSTYASILDDILTLARLRHGQGGVKEGERDIFLFCGAIAAAIIYPDGADRGIDRLVSILIPGADRKWIEDRLVSLRDRVSRHQAGERLVDGRSPIYTPTIRWYIRQLTITRKEMEGLTVLVDEAVSRRRRRGLPSRQAWVAKMDERRRWSEAKAVEAVEVLELKHGDAASRLAVSRKWVTKLLEGIDWNGLPCSTLRNPCPMQAGCGIPDCVYRTGELVCPDSDGESGKGREPSIGWIP